MDISPIQSTVASSGSSPAVSASTAAARSASQQDGDTVELSSAALDKAASSDGEPSTIKSLTYGALRLPSPEEQARETNTSYKVGTYLGAAATVGAVVSMLL